MDRARGGAVHEERLEERQENEWRVGGSGKGRGGGGNRQVTLSQ